MERIENVTLEQAYKYVREDMFSFAFWTVEGNYLGLEIPVKGENVKTRMFLSKSIFIIGLSVDVDGFSVMVSKTDFIDLWYSVKRKYPKLFESEVKGNVMLAP